MPGGERAPVPVLFAGVDEAGRGPLAGPVSAAAVILDPTRPILGVGDSKGLTPRQRERLDATIRARATAWAVAFATVQEIDALNILQASLLAMRRAVEALSLQPELVLVDGNQCPELGIPTRALVKGDALEPAIGAASILAKVARDRLMEAMERRYPGYGFAQHKGYPTQAHLRALQVLGPCPEHRRSFGPVRRVILTAAADPGPEAACSG